MKKNQPFLLPITNFLLEKIPVVNHRRLTDTTSISTGFHFREGFCYPMYSFHHTFYPKEWKKMMNLERNPQFKTAATMGLGLRQLRAINNVAGKRPSRIYLKGKQRCRPPGLQQPFTG